LSRPRLLSRGKANTPEQVFIWGIKVSRIKAPVTFKTGQEAGTFFMSLIKPFKGLIYIPQAGSNHRDIIGETHSNR
jgi:hypothetical protein